MKRCVFAVHRVLVAGAFCGAALLALSTPAIAATAVDDRHMVVNAYPGCDFAVAEWVITWTVSNPGTVAATIGNVRVTPPSALVGLPDRVQPGETVQGIQRVPGNAFAATITFDVNYDDGVVTYNDVGSASLGQCGPSASRYVDVSVNTICDAAAGEWVISYNVTNPNPIAGTIGNIRVMPAGRPLVGMSPRLYPLGTVTGTQRIPANEYTASITFDVNWDDGVVTYNSYRPVYIKSTCGTSI